jgi:hypothetical protein
MLVMVYFVFSVCWVFLLVYGCKDRQNMEIGIDFTKEAVADSAQARFP